MKTLPWFRMYHEARNDKKLATLDDHEFRVWFNLLSLASEQHPRGVIPQMSYRVLAIEVSGGDIEILNETITKLEALDVLANDGDVLWFIHFEERNHDKPSDMPEQVGERVKRHRANKKEALQNDVTPLKRDVTPSNAQEEKRIDKKRVEENSDSTESEGSANAPQKQPTPLRSVPKAHAQTVPDDFTVTDDMRRQAEGYGVPSTEIDRETEKFRDHFKAHGKKMTDWPAAWRNWMRRVSEFSPRQTNGTGGKFGPKGPDAAWFAQQARDLERQGR